MLAKLLTPFEFGVWGFVQMIILYFSHFDFGIPSSFNTLAAIHKKSERYITYSFGASLILISILCLLILLMFFIKQFFSIPIGVKYNFDSYLLSVLVIIILGYLNKLFFNLFRVFNRLKEITFYQAVVPITLSITYILFKENLIQKILIGTIIANFLAFLLFLYFSPVNIKIFFHRRLLTQIQNSGFFFFLYNTSFYFMMLSTRTIISIYFGVEEFGQFNFALSLSTIIELSVSSISFLIFPKVINHFASAKNEKALFAMNFMQTNYTLLVSILTYTAIAGFPLVIHFFPNFGNSSRAFVLLLLSHLVYSNCFGSPALLMARRKERKLAITAFSMFLLNIIITVGSIRLLNVDFAQVIIGITITYFIYVILVTRQSLLELMVFDGYKNLFAYSFPQKFIFPLITGIVLALINASFIFYSLLLIFFIFMNFKQIWILKRNIQNLIINPSVLDI